MAFDYNERVIAHFLDPQNVGIIENADGVGKVGDASCGDEFVMFIRVEQERLVDIKYLIQGCGAAIATCSALSVVAKGLSINDALALTDDDIARELGGLPLEKLHCSNMAATALHRAIADFERRKVLGKVARRHGDDWRDQYRRVLDSSLI